MTTNLPLRVLQPNFVPAGTEVGGFRVRYLYGLGACGLVYLADKPGEETSPVALKLARLAEDPRFEREAELLSRTHHPSIPRLWAHGQWAHPEGPFPFLAMEWVDGQSLYATVQGLGLSPRQVARWVGQVASALAAVHAAGGLHRDVKGSNILVRAGDSRAMLMDFGAGDYLGAGTLTHAVLPPGTPPYRSPEALRFQQRYWNNDQAHYQATAADDMYALGVTAWRLVTGLYPARDKSLVPLPSLVTVPLELAAWIHRMLSAQPSSRPGAVEVAEAFEQFVAKWGPEADQPIATLPALSSSLLKAWRKPKRLKPWRLLRTCAPYAGAGVAFTATLMLIHSVWSAVSSRVHWTQSTGTQEQRDGGVEDAGTSGLGNEGTLASVSVEGPELSGKALRTQVPKQPLPHQARPPCIKPEMEIHGGCWRISAEPSPPCAGRDYEWQGLCYGPVLDPTRPTTSEDP